MSSNATASLEQKPVSLLSHDFSFEACGETNLDISKATKLAKKSLQEMHPVDPTTISLNKFKVNVKVKAFFKTVLDWTIFVTNWVQVNDILTPAFSLFSVFTSGTWLILTAKDHKEHKKYISNYLEFQKQQLEEKSKAALEKIQDHPFKNSLNGELNEFQTELTQDTERYITLQNEEEKAQLISKWKDQGIEEALFKEISEKGLSDSGLQHRVEEALFKHLTVKAWQGILQAVSNKATLELDRAKGAIKEAAVDFSLVFAQAAVMVPLAILVLAGVTSGQPTGLANWIFIGVSLATAGLGLLYLYYTRPNLFKVTFSTVQNIYFSMRKTLASWSTAISRATKKSKLLKIRYRQLALAELILKKQVAKKVSAKDRKIIERYKKQLESAEDPQKVFAEWTKKANTLTCDITRLNNKISKWNDKISQLKKEIKDAEFLDLVRQRYNFNPGKDNQRGFIQVVFETMPKADVPTEESIAYGKVLTRGGIDLDRMEEFRQKPRNFNKHLWKIRCHPNNQDILDLVALTAKEGEQIPNSVKKFLKRQLHIKKVPDAYTKEVMDQIKTLKDPFGINEVASNVIRVDPKLEHPLTIELLKLMKIDRNKLHDADIDEAQRTKDLQRAMRFYFGMDEEKYKNFIDKLQKVGV